MVDELHNEISILKEILDKKEKQSSENNFLISELRAENQMLCRQMTEIIEKERGLRKEVNVLKEKYHLDRIKINDQYLHIESLKVELSLSIRKKCELEKQIDDLKTENKYLCESLKVLQSRILLLENNKAEKDNLLTSTLRDLENLRTSNHYLTEKLEIVSNSISSTACKESLMSEIEHFEGESWTQSW